MHLSQKTILAGFALVCASAAPALAQYDAFTAGRTILRAGPSSDYPRVDSVPGGVPVDIYGCLRGFSWCDIEWGDRRGWARASSLDIAYEGRRGLVTRYAPLIGVPIIGFTFGDYWDRYYNGYDFYRQRNDYARRFGFGAPGPGPVPPPNFGYNPPFAPPGGPPNFGNNRPGGPGRPPEFGNNGPGGGGPGGQPQFNPPGGGQGGQPQFGNNRPGGGGPGGQPQFNPPGGGQGGQPQVGNNQPGGGTPPRPTGGPANPPGGRQTAGPAGGPPPGAGNRPPAPGTRPANCTPQSQDPACPSPVPGAGGLPPLPNGFPPPPR